MINKADPLGDIDLNGLWQMQQRIHACMEEKGFHDGRTGNGRDDTLVRLCLIHTEVSEAADVVKKKGITTPAALEEFGYELADIAIRLCDLAECTGVGLAGFIEAKMRRNMARPHKYGTPEAGKGVTNG